MGQLSVVRVGMELHSSKFKRLSVKNLPGLAPAPQEAMLHVRQVRIVHVPIFPLL